MVSYGNKYPRHNARPHVVEQSGQCARALTLELLAGGELRGFLRQQSGVGGSGGRAGRGQPHGGRGPGETRALHALHFGGPDCLHGVSNCQQSVTYSNFTKFC